MILRFTSSDKRCRASYGQTTIRYRKDTSVNGSLLIVAILVACGVAGGLARLAEHRRGRHARPTSGGSGGNVLDAIVVDPLT